MTTRKITTLAVGLMMISFVSATAYAGGRGGDTYRPMASAPSGRIMTMMASLDPAQRKQMVTECELMMGNTTPTDVQK